MTDRLVAGIVPVLVALAAGAALLAWAGADPIEAVGEIYDGSFGSWDKVGATLMVFAPLALAAASLVITFHAGLWNIGVEGQIAMGAIGAALVARSMGGPGPLVMIIAALVGVATGGAWGLLVGFLRERGGVNEIFGGLGLTFVATGLSTWLIIGPWKREGVASTSGTDPFREAVWFPTWGEAGRFSPVSVALALAGAGIVAWLMHRTSFGLRVRAVGGNPDAAARMGVRPQRVSLGALFLAGGLAGLAGVHQVMAFHHKLVPTVSGGYGFLGILVVLLAARRIGLVLPIALFFAATSVGSLRMELTMDVDGAVAGAFQALLVLCVVLGGGLVALRAARRWTGAS